jgi:hypothetical protein
MYTVSKNWSQIRRLIVTTQKSIRLSSRMLIKFFKDQIGLVRFGCKKRYYFLITSRQMHQIKYGCSYKCWKTSFIVIGICKHKQKHSSLTTWCPRFEWYNFYFFDLFKLSFKLWHSLVIYTHGCHTTRIWVGFPPNQEFTCSILSFSSSLLHNFFT